MAKKIFMIPVDCEIYSSCDQVMLVNYEGYLNSQDNIWFTNYHELVKAGKNAKKPHLKDLEEAFYSFFGDMLKITKNPRVLDRFEHISKILKFRTKYNSVMTIIGAIEGFNPDLPRDLLMEHIENLAKWNYRLDTNKELFGQLDKIKERVRGFLTEIELLEKKISDNDQETVTNLNKELIQVATFIDLRFAIDKNTTTVAQWLEYCEIYKEKAENQKPTKN